MSGLLSICCCCHKIKDVSGNWKEKDISALEQSGYELTHGFCPDCIARLYPHTQTKMKSKS